MNRIFRIVWNRTLGRLVVTSEHARSASKGGRSAAGGARATAGMKFAALGMGVALALASPFAAAHTISVGYTNSGSGALTFWYGTYHDPSEASNFEGTFKLVGPNGYEELVNFDERATSTPDGLEDGVNNFYAAASTGTQLVSTSKFGPVLTWQGVSFADLKPGTYVYTYIAAANPTDSWNPYQPVLTNTLTITGADLNGFPLDGGLTYDETTDQLKDPYSILFNDGTFKPTTAVEFGQDVTVRSGGGTVDTSNGNVTFTGDVDGNGTLTKTGTGTLTLTGDSSFTGNTIVGQGTLKGDTDSLKGNIANAGTVNFDQSTDGSYTSVISGAGNVVKSGTGTLVLTGANTYTGGTTVAEGTLQGDTTSLQGNITNNGTVAFSQSTNGTYAGTISGTGDLVKQGTGTVTLTGANTYTGDTTVGAGTLALSGNGSISGGNLTVDTGGTFDTSAATHDTTVSTLTGNGTVALGSKTLEITDADGSFGGTIGGTGQLAIDSGTQTLSGNNTYSGGTRIADGTTVNVGSNSALGTGTVQLNGGTLHTDADRTLANDITVSDGGTFTQDTDTTLNLNGDVDGSGDFVKNGEGTLVASGTLSHTGATIINDGTLTLSGTNTYSQGTYLNGGTLNVSSDGNLGNTAGGLTFNGGTLVNSGNLDSNRGVTLSADGHIVTGAGDVTSLGGTVSGAGGLDLQGSGTTVLSGTNTYAGGTQVANGTLEISNDGNLGQAGTGISLDGATLHTTDDVDSSRDIVLSSSLSHIDTDLGTTFSTTGNVTGAGDLEKNGGGTLQIDGNVSLDAVGVFDGTLVLNGTNSFTGTSIVTNGSTLQVNSGDALGMSSGGDLVMADGILKTTGNVDTSAQFGLLGSGIFDMGTGTTMASHGEVNGPGSLIKTGAGTLVLDHANTYTGGTRIDDGTLQIASDAALGDGGTLVFNGGSLNTTANIQSSRAVQLDADASIDTDAGTSMAVGGTVSGTGELIKNGEGLLEVDGVASHTGGTTVNDGALVLTGANTYTGGNHLNGGVLAVSSDGNLGAASNGIDFNGGELFTGNSFTTARNLTVSGDGGTVYTQAGTTLTATGSLSGASGLVKDGEGTLDLSGVASHQGGTTVNDGTLILRGSNTYTGGTTLNGGTLQVSADANLGNASNGIDFDGGTLHTTGSFSTARSLTLDASANVSTDAGTTLTATGTVSGASGLVKTGSGTLVLQGTNSYAGGTTINGGTLQVSSDANLGATSGNIAIDGGTLTVTKSMTTARDIAFGSNGASIDTLTGVTLTQQGDMSGTGGLVKLGGGTLIVSGNNSFTGGTLIDGGIIRIDSGSSLGTGAILLNGGTLQTVATLGTGQQVIISGNSGVNVDAGTTTVLSGTLAAAAGDGCFTKTGKGKLSLTGAANLASGTCVQDGILSANGNLASSYVQVDQGAMLRGVGIISGPVNVEGTLAAGNSPGTLTVQGTVTMQSTSTLQVDIDGLGTANGAGNYSRVLVTGTGNQFIADGTLAPTLRGITGDASNTYTPALGSSYRIVTADGGVVGRFSALTQPTSGLAANTRFVAFYGVNDGHSIDLRVAPTSYVGFMGVGAKRNGVAAASALDGSLVAQDAGTASAGQTALLYAVSSLDAGHVGTLVQTLSGEVHADQAAAARAAGLGMQRDVTDHLGTDIESADASHRVWANLTRDGNRSIADNQGTGFETGTDRTTAGVDLYAENGTVLGVAATHHDTNVIAHGGDGSIRGNSGMVYAQQAMGRFVLDGVAAYGRTDWTTRRADPLGGTSLESRTSGNDAIASATLRMPMTTAGGNRIEPYASVIWQKVERDASTERGTSAAALSLDSLSQHGTRVLGGLALGSKAADPLSTTLTWRAGVAIGADTGDLLDPTVHNTMSGQRFDTSAPDVGRGFVQVNANGTMRLGKSTYLYGGITAEEGQRRSAYGVTAGVRVAF